MKPVTPAIISGISGPGIPGWGTAHGISAPSPGQNSACVPSSGNASIPSATFSAARRFSPRSFDTIHPQTAIKWEFRESLSQIGHRIGKDTLDHLMAGGDIVSPVAQETDGEWIKTAKIIGINPRALGTYWDIVKYAMTFPEDTVHLLPLYEPGCDGSLYAPVNWRVNDEFLSVELSEMGFVTAEEQLRLVIRFLHALGKKVGMDVVPHTDRFSETVLVHPDFFEWIRLNDEKTAQVESSDGVAESVKRCIVDFVCENGFAETGVASGVKPEEIFSESIPETQRSHFLFGPPENRDLRLNRRLALMQWVRGAGFETLPVAMYRPFRQARFDRMERSPDGQTWPVFSIPGHGQKQIFGSLTPYNFFHSAETDSPQTYRPHAKARAYFAEQVVRWQQQFGFDFMRVDMAHVQQNPDGVNPNPRNEHEKGIWRYVKERVRKSAPYFASFAEHFVEDPRCSFGDPHQNIQADAFDVALGNLQYFGFNGTTSHHVRRFNLSGLIHGTSFKISNTVSTLDNDDMDELYASHPENLLRLFLAYFLNQPSYVAMGFEARERPVGGRLQFSARQFIQDTLKKREGEYLWHDPGSYFAQVSRLRSLYTHLRDGLLRSRHWWLDTSYPGILSWMYFDDSGKISHIFIANVGGEAATQPIFVKNPFHELAQSGSSVPHENFLLTPVYTTNLSPVPEIHGTPDANMIRVSPIESAGARIYSVK